MVSGIPRGFARSYRLSQAKGNKSASAKQERELKKQEKVEAHQQKLKRILSTQAEPDILSPVGTLKSKYLLGYGLVAPILDRFGGCGPRLAELPEQRDLSHNTVNRLIEMGGTGGQNSGARRPSTPSLEPPGGFRTMAKFTEAAMEEDAVVYQYAGAHRTAALGMIFKEPRETAKRLDAQVKKSGRALKAKDAELRQRAIQTLNEQATWLVAFYTGMARIFTIYGVSERGPPRAHRQQRADLPRRHSPNPVEPRRACSVQRGHARRLPPSPERCAYLRAERRRRAAPPQARVVAAMINLQAMPTFSKSQFTLSPAELVEATQVIWGLQFLLAPGKNLKKESLGPRMADVVAFSQYIANVLQTPDRPCYALDALLQIFDDAFQNHLHKNFKWFGQSYKLEKGAGKKNKWDAAYDEYLTEVETRIAEVIEELARDARLANEPDLADVLSEELLWRIRMIANGGLRSYPFIDPGHRVPFLCPRYVRMVFVSLRDIAPMLSLVVNWFVPNLCDADKLRGNRKAQASSVTANTPSHLCLLLHHLVYFHGEQDQDKWAKSPCDTAKMQYWSFSRNQSQPSFEAATAFLDLLFIVLRCRSVTLVPGMGSIVAAQCMDEVEEGEEDDEMKLEDDEASNVEPQGAEYQGQNDRHSPSPPPEVPALRVQGFPRHPIATRSGFRGFERSAYSFLVSPTGTNDPKVRLRFMRNMYEEYMVYKMHVYPALEEMQGVDAYPLSLKAQLLEHLRGKYPGFAQYDYWYNEETKRKKAPKFEPVPHPTADDIVRAAAIPAQDLKLAQLRKHFRQFSRPQQAGLGGGRGQGRAQGQPQTFDAQKQTSRIQAKGQFTRMAYVWPPSAEDLAREPLHKYGIQIRAATVQEVVEYFPPGSVIGIAAAEDLPLYVPSDHPYYDLAHQRAPKDNEFVMRGGKRLARAHGVEGADIEMVEDEEEAGGENTPSGGGKEQRRAARSRRAEMKPPKTKERPPRAPLSQAAKSQTRRPHLAKGTTSQWRRSARRRTTRRTRPTRLRNPSSNAVALWPARGRGPCRQAQAPLHLNFSFILLSLHPRALDI
ncbi:hypothetical protein C8F04DRAFT_1192818 [Mycena alexandri]|uniref:Uncharacterized protein n=1 Tax=Mycena alexandri TaxID=1745969 RepID=A0AAD6WS50_9AGAR|nr:hypothetical protein C8F04DRAFT_1195341 [Mycena alexandri]KAJ7024080.1 hypothetical protein C8F04DRAFT_1192818 [Mycena alexandri]